jgi:murein L,D-transpeptidase YcbB/YkuD
MTERSMRWSRIVAVGALVACVAYPVRAQERNPFATATQELLAQRDRPIRTERRAEREALDRIYDVPTPRAIWLSVDGRPTSQALAMIELLAASADRGLSPSDYQVETLRRLADAARSNAPMDAARFDVALSHAAAMFLTDLYTGRVDPTSIRLDFPIVKEPPDLASLVTGVARATDVSGAVGALEPRYAGYAWLVRALARYRLLAADTTLRRPTRAPRTVRPGERYPDVAALARLLAALGDLDSASAARVMMAARTDSVPVYDGGIVDAVVRFQRRHGLDADSAIGTATMAALRVPIGRRVRQIELTLERWRWLPSSPPDRYVVVNIPGFRLYALEHDSVARSAALSMNVIVGQATGRHDTPVFSAVMREVVFRPYWDVPPRIARTELIPLFRRRPGYFAHEGFEIVSRSTGDVPGATFAPTTENFGRVVAGSLRLRQRPGPANALGHVKFVFPNRYNVYLHGTPAQELFAHSRRDFSHGCIRIERPNDLAELVLRAQPSWDLAAILAAIDGTRTVHVPIARPVTVYVLYATAAASEKGAVSFYPDLYGRDAALERALGLAAIPGTDFPAPPR